MWEDGRPPFFDTEDRRGFYSELTNDKDLRDVVHMLAMVDRLPDQGLIYQLYLIGIASCIISPDPQQSQSDREIAEALIPLVERFVLVVKDKEEHPTACTS